jgi:hypothetical protein
MSSAAKTPAAKKSAAKKAVKSQRKTINRQHQNQRRSKDVELHLSNFLKKNLKMLCIS